MALSYIDFDGITIDDLNAQIVAAVPEGTLVDYKREMYGRGDADTKEFLKDVSSFANTSGGHLLIGIDETEGIPTRIVPITGDPDQDLQRLESLARDGIEPRIIGLRMKALRCEGGYVIAIRVPKSWNPPHRVSARNTNRIFGRNSAGTYEFSVEELRVIFTASANAFDRIRSFRAERLARIEAGEAIVPIAQNRGRLVVHIVSAASFGLNSQIDLNKAYAEQDHFNPMGGMGYSPQINFDGFSNLNPGNDGNCWSYTHVFRNGALEAVKVRVVSDLRPGQLFIPTLDFDKWIFQRLPGYLAGLQNLEVPPPLVMMITLQGVRGARLGVYPTPIDDPPAILRDVLALPEIIIERYGSELDYQRAARPAFDALWNAGGYAKSNHFDATGALSLPR
jgi:hypothetical protein